MVCFSYRVDVCVLLLIHQSVLDNRGVSCSDSPCNPFPDDSCIPCDYRDRQNVSAGLQSRPLKMYLIDEPEDAELIVKPTPCLASQSGSNDTRYGGLASSSKATAGPAA